VIQQLPDELRDPVCIFYLVLRGLDSVEDDMTFPLQHKRPLLLSFHEKLSQDGWTIRDVGDGPDYRVLLAHFDKVITVFKTLKAPYQNVIADVTKRMGKGMSDFAEKKLVNTTDDYNLYCHYVAGLVGHGLTRLFACSNLEDAKLESEDSLRVGNSMGLFLQKTNIIRDYLEDLDAGRTWWPQQIWGEHAKSLDHFKHHPTAPESVACLNHMVTDALELVPDCLQYLTRLSDPLIFRFCAIPQVMAIATLAQVYNNTDVFRRVVKIRKGLTAKLMLDTNNMDAVYSTFHALSKTMLQAVPEGDPSSKRTRELLQFIITATSGVPNNRCIEWASRIIWTVLIVSAIYLLYQTRQKNIDMELTGRVPSRPSLDWVIAVVFFLCLSYVFGFFGLSYV